MNIKKVLPFLSEGNGKESASSADDVKQTGKSSEESISVSSEIPKKATGQKPGREGTPSRKEPHVAPPGLRGPGYVIGKGLRDGKPIRLPAEGRIHTLIVGKSGTGKTTFMLTQMLQDAERGDSVFVFDPQGDLAERFMSFLPEGRWEDVVYVNPTTHQDYEQGVVKFNFLSFKKIRQADLETDAFMEPLHKLYTDFWGPRLEGIMRNGINLLRDSGKDFTLFELANILSNDSERKALLHDADDHQKRFWRHDFEKMPDKSPTAALTKMYKLTQSETLRPMIDTTYSTVDLYDCMQKGKIVIFDLRTSQLAGGYPEFLGSLFLARLTMLGMVRQEIPKEDRTPVHVYADEAHRFVTETIADNMRALRKYRVYFTIASQNLQEYEGRASNELPELAETVVAFQCGRGTAENVESAFSMIGEGNRRRVSDAIANLNFYNFYMSTQVGLQKRSKEIPARTIDPGRGSTNYSDIIRKSLKIYGEEVEPRREVSLKGFDLSLEEFTPVEYYVLQEVCTTGKIRLDKLKSRLKDDYGIDSGQDVRRAVGRLTERQLMAERQEETQRETVKRMLFYEPTSKGVRKLYPRWKPRARAGGPDHVEMICRLMRKFRKRNCYPIPLDAKDDVEELKKKEKWERLETVPDLLILRPAEMGRETSPDDWSDQILAAEAEAFPRGEKSGGAKGSGTKGSRTVEHFDNAVDMGFPVAFGVKEGDEEYVRKKLREETEVEFTNIRKKPVAGCAELNVVDVGGDDTGGNLEKQIEDMREKAAKAREKRERKGEKTRLIKELRNIVEDRKAKGLTGKAEKLEKVRRNLQMGSLSLEETKEKLKEWGVAVPGIKELTGEKKKPETEVEAGKERKPSGEVEGSREVGARDQSEKRAPERSEAEEGKRASDEVEAEEKTRGSEEEGLSESKVSQKEGETVEMIPEEIKTLEDLEAVKEHLKKLLEDSSRSEEAADLISQLKEKEECKFRESRGSAMLRAKVYVPDKKEKKWREKSAGSLNEKKMKLFERAGVELDWP